MEGQIYHITGNVWGWIYPLFCLGGLFIQFCGALFKYWPLIAAGTIITAVGAIPEHDIALLAGSLLITAAFWFLISTKKQQQQAAELMQRIKKRLRKSG